MFKSKSGLFVFRSFSVHFRSFGVIHGPRECLYPLRFGLPVTVEAIGRPNVAQMNMHHQIEVFTDDGNVHAQTVSIGCVIRMGKPNYFAFRGISMVENQVLFDCLGTLAERSVRLVFGPVSRKANRASGGVFGTTGHDGDPFEFV